MSVKGLTVSGGGAFESTLSGNIVPGTWIPMFENVSATGTLILNAAGEKAATVFQVPPGVTTITDVHFRVGAAANPQNLTIALRTVDSANGNPTATLYGGSGTVTQLPVANTSYSLTLST